MYICVCKRGSVPALKKRIEATITAAELIKEFMWQKVLKFALSFQGGGEMARFIYKMFTDTDIYVKYTLE